LRCIKKKEEERAKELERELGLAKEAKFIAELKVKEDGAALRILELKLVEDDLIIKRLEKMLVYKNGGVDKNENIKRNCFRNKR